MFMDEELLKETIELDIDEENELLFKIHVEGADQPAKVRLVCETSDVSFMFYGSPTEQDGVVQFLIPELKNKTKEKLMESKIEVLIGNKYFVPVEFNIDLKQKTKVFAESAVPTIRNNKPKTPVVTVAASPIIATPRSKPIENKLVIEAPKKRNPQGIKPISNLRQKWLNK